MIALDKRGAINYYKSMKTPISKSQTRAMKLGDRPEADCACVENGGTY